MKRIKPERSPGMNGGDERGVSFTLGYVLTVSIAVLLVGTMFISAGQLVTDEQTRTIRAEAEVVGDQTAAGFMAADRLIQRGNRSNVTIDLRLPQRLAGQSYSITVRANESEASIVVSTESPSVTVVTPMVNRTPIAETTVAGSDIRVIYRANDRLTLERDDA